MDSSTPSPPEETDSVVDLVRRGNASALETLLAAHRDYLRRVVDLRMNEDLRRRVDPSDIVQETHMEALRRVADYARDPKLSVRLWMRQIAIDRLNMAYRRHVSADKRSLNRELRLPDRSAMTLARQLIAEADSPSRNVSRDELVRIVRRAVDRLADSDREIIVLQAFEGLNSTESAQVLGIEPATARKRYGRALLRMRRLLVESGLGDSQP
jgi:RNA polymerase sigma-70 factor (ECF subfamily)